MKMTNLYQQLSEPFPQEMIRSINKSGVNLLYVPVAEVINRLNKILGVDKWSFTIIKCERDAMDTDNIVAHVRIVWCSDSGSGCVSRDGIDGSRIMRTKQGQIVDLGDAYKSAVSNALKKAASTLGLGLYLSRSDEAIEIEQVMDTVPDNLDARAVWDNFISISKNFTAEQKTELRSKWNEWSGGRAIPQRESVVMSDAEFLHAEVVATAFSEKKKD